MPDQFLVFEKALKKRRRTWKWRVCTPEGGVVMQGSESSRPAARYQANRALFLLLLSASISIEKACRSGQSRFQGYPRAYSFGPLRAHDKSANSS